MLTKITEKDIERCLNNLQTDIHGLAVAKDWWLEDRSDGELIALCHSELSESLEALRKGNPESEKIPGHCHAVEELADCAIRMFDMCQKRGWNLAQAILDKHRFNHSRPPKHGKLF